MAVTGGISLVAYLNLLTVGFSIQEFSLFLLQRIETYMFLIGLFLIWLIVYLSKTEKKSLNNRKKY
ncbi:hypothetical protein CR194_10140 [Salipaludibacillus keqinensis]|uniref:Uncharacterized protein n=2 Tax=Salipaludibacillus keqinensis TaxID=2045207 RepID=A0A323TMN2_9BACI|nr:hypothetical protein CR194_10140 [Salipaludibacillus keqinensis]